MNKSRIYRNNYVQCKKCRCFGAHQKEDEIYWTCDNCGFVGGIFNEPNAFLLRVHNSTIKRTPKNEK